MAFTHNIILLFSAIALLYQISITTAQVEFTAAASSPTAAPPSRNGDDFEVINDVKNNKFIQDLGMLAIEKQNLGKSLAESISFIEVEKAKRWPVGGGFMYFLKINSKKKVNDAQVEGSFYAYVHVKEEGDRTFKTGIFQVPNE